MKKLVLFSAAVAALAAAPAAAQPQRPMGQGMTRADVESRVAAQFQRVDANRDGFVTQAEAEAARNAFRAQAQQRRGERRDALFARLDVDRNGVISREEFNAPRQRAEAGERGERRMARGDRQGQRFAGRGMRGRMGGGFGPEAFQRLDADRDGRISLAEATRARLERFDRVDQNDDGRITREEVQALRAQRPAR